MAESFIPFGRIKRHPKAWLSDEVKEAVSKRRKVFAEAHSNDEDRQVYLSAFRRASSVIAKTKAKAWQATCSSLSFQCNSKSVYFLLRSVAGSSLSFSPLLTSPTVPLPESRLRPMSRLPEIPLFCFSAKGSV